MSSQSRIDSLAEACVSTAIGYGVALIGQLLVFPRYGIHPPLSVNLWISFWFTLLSLLRGYAIRRFFNSYYRRLVGFIALNLRKVLHDN